MTNRNKNERQVCVLLPNKEQLSMTVGMKVRGQEVFSRLSELLGVKELHLFGLSVLRDEEHLFLDLERKLTKYFGKEWKGRSYKDPVCLHLRVQYYVEHSQLLPCSSRVQYLYYADLKQRVLHSQCYHQEALFFQLAAYALQAEMGDLAAPGTEGGGETKGGERMGKGGEEGEIEGQEERLDYFNPLEYLPPWVVRRRGRGYVLLHTPLLHADLRGVTPGDAVLLFISEATSSLQTVPVSLYRLRQGKKERKGSVLLGLALKGVCIYQEVGGVPRLLYDFSWSSIDRLTFQGRRFEVRAVGSLMVPQLVFYAPSALHTKHLLKHLSDSHRFHMNTRTAAAQIRQREENQVGQPYREAYIYDRVGLALRLRRSSGGEGSFASTATPERRVSMAMATSVADVWLRPTGPRSEATSPWLPEIELCVDEPEEVCVDDPEDEMMWLAELPEGVSVDGPVLMPASHWADVTVEMKQVLKTRTPDGVSVD